jgi:hypothetical protein
MSRQRGGKDLYRQGEMLHRYIRVSQEEIGSYLEGIDYTSVNHERSQIRDWLKDNATVKRWLWELKNA